MRIKLVRTIDKNQWNGIYSYQSFPNAFNSYAYLKIAKARYVLFLENNELVGGIPVKKKGWKLWISSGEKNDWQDILIKKGYEERAFKCFKKFLNQRKQSFLYSKVPESSRIIRYFSQKELLGHSYVVDLRKGFNAWLDEISQKRQGKYSKKHFPSLLAFSKSMDKIYAHFNKVIFLHKENISLKEFIKKFNFLFMKRRNFGLQNIRKDWPKNLRKHYDSDLLEFSILELDGKPACGLIFFANEEVIHYWNGAWDNPSILFRKLNISKVLLMMSIKWAAENNYKFFDFMSTSLKNQEENRHLYKERFSNLIIPQYKILL